MYLNKKVITIIALTILSLIGLTVYTFGPYSNLKKTPKLAQPVPASPVASQKSKINNQDVVLSTFQNRDIQGDFYSINFPTSWQVNKLGQSGSYTFQFPEGTGQVSLLEVPDNTTLELYVLSQEEPKLKKSIPGYQRSNYQKLIINSNDAYQLIYTNSQDNSKTLQTYISGPDMAAVITFTMSPTKFTALDSILQSVLNSFLWESK